ncbi:hypothetical protein [Streptomyces sp. NPDC057002]|uniref:hypothetical protein n=1 Tax=Streptomyces sp. NPDC057002 TaxID=3345992 RepID=UPI00363E5B62
MVTAKSVRRETFLGQSRLDFLVNADTYVEVKTPWTTSTCPSATTSAPPGLLPLRQPPSSSPDSSHTRNWMDTARFHDR